MFRMEFHAADGGKDAEKFAHQLANAVSKFATQLRASNEGRVIVLSTEHRI